MTETPAILTTKPLVVGEVNPHSSDPRYDLVPFPAGCAGARLCQILGISKAEYLVRFRRLNLCRDKWSADAARRTAEAIAALWQGPIILLGRKVAAAFGLAWAPLMSVVTDAHRTFYVLPHPSGRCRSWNDGGAYESARRLLAPVVEKARIV